MTVLGMIIAGARRVADRRERRRQRRAARAQLAMMDDRLLRDLGLERAVVTDELHQSASRPLGELPGEGHLLRRPIDTGLEDVPWQEPAERTAPETGIGREAIDTGPSTRPSVVSTSNPRVKGPGPKCLPS